MGWGEDEAEKGSYTSEKVNSMCVISSVIGSQGIVVEIEPTIELLLICLV